MQTLYILRGPQGSGKSTFLREKGLTPWTVSTDQMRQLYGSLSMDSEGRFRISQVQNALVYEKIKEILHVRMQQGLTTFVDATHADSDFNLYKKMAARWAYEIVIIEFGLDVSFTQLQQRLEIRERGDPSTYIPRQVLRSFVDQLSNRPVPKGMRSISASDFIQLGHSSIAGIASIESRMIMPDYSHYRDVVFIGDVQGCATPLKKMLDDHYSDERLMIFTGDLFDRGPENGEVMLIMDALLDKPNVKLLCGNHERHLLSWINDEYPTGEFLDRTLPQLKEKGFDKAVAQRFVNRWDNLLQFQMGDSLFQVLHGGASAVIEQPHYFPGYQCWKGSGDYSEDVDRQFERNAPEPWHQVHGHRNSLKRDLTANQRSFNLEGGVEHGGQLRALRFDGNAFTPILISNRVFIPMIEQRLFQTKTLPHWLLDAKEKKLTESQFDDQAKISEEDLSALRAHELVREAVQEKGHISSFNFTRDAFYKQAFDSCNTRARGLFINTTTREVVIRGYDKYFNVNERGIEQAKLETVLENTKPPYSTTIKENGSLGLLGYDKETDSLVYASKSTLSGDHALWLKDQITDMLGYTQLLELKCLLRDAQMCLTFELIEPVKDPHIIAYSHRKVVLLDGIRRAMDFETISHEKLSTIAQEFGFEVKQPGAFLKTKVALAGFLKKSSKSGLKFNGQEIEGVVIQDANGSMLKIKLPYYNFWKGCRSAAQAVKRHHEKGSPIKPHFRADPNVSTFIDWLLTKPVTWSALDIISLRDAIVKEKPEFSDITSKKFEIEDSCSL